MSDKPKPHLLPAVPLSEIAQMLLRLAEAFESAGAIVRTFAQHRDANALEAQAQLTRANLRTHELLMKFQDRLEQVEQRLTGLEERMPR